MIKNDVRNAGWSFEVKTTTKASYSLSLRTWETAERNALTDGRRAAMVICYDMGLGKSPKRVVVIGEDDFIELTHDLDVMREELEFAESRIVVLNEENGHS
jgi:hypothetical protein